MKHRLAVALLLVLTIATGCDRTAGEKPWRIGDSGAPAAPRAPEFNHHDLLAALAKSAILPGFKDRSSCLNRRAACAHLTRGYGFYRFATRETSVPDTYEMVIVGAARWRSEARAQDATSHASDLDHRRCHGRYRTPVKNLAENRYRPGERGRGHREDIEIRTWRGYGCLTRMRFLHPNGTHSHVTTIAHLYVVEGRYTLQVTVFRPSSAHGPEGAHAIAERLLERLITRLDWRFIRRHDPTGWIDESARGVT